MATAEKVFANAVPAAIPKHSRAHKRRAVLRRAVTAAVILGAGTLLGLPLLLHGLLPRGHDVPQHLRRYAAFRQSFSMVNPYPRWLSKANAGLGDPVMFVYGPLPYMVAAALRPFAPSSLGGHAAFPEFVLAAWVALLASGFTCFLWLQTFVPWKSALAAAVLYLAVPFHLWGNLYIRGDIPECWALLWMPLTLFFVHGVAARRRHAEIGLAISYALLVASHLFTVVLFSPVLLAYAAVIVEGGQRVRNVLRTGAGMALGVGVSAAYLFTALAHETNISASRFLSEGGYVFARDFLQFSKDVLLDKDLLQRGGHFAGRLTWVTLDTIAVAACAAFVAWRASQRRQVRFWISVCFLSLFLMSPVSLGIWRVVPGLELLQFPWRLNDVVCVAVAALLAMALAQFSRRFRVSDWVAVALGVLLLAAWGEAYLHVWRQYDLQRYEMARRDDVALADDTLRFVWLRWTPPELYTPQALAELGQRPPAEFVGSPGTATVTSLADRHIEITTTSVSGGPLLVRQFFYPGWTARDENGEWLSVRPSHPEGLISITAPPGAHHVHLTLPLRNVELASWWITALSLLACAAGLKLRLDSTPRGYRTTLGCQ
ncbi:MAG TPA: hypothetical protein VJP04_06670 [Terriglobales bacterium]|nr:hypothetical protein [Terriglobales bacterium]